MGGSMDKLRGVRRPLGQGWQLLDRYKYTDAECAHMYMCVCTYIHMTGRESNMYANLVNIKGGHAPVWGESGRLADDYTAQRDSVAEFISPPKVYTFSSIGDSATYPKKCKCAHSATKDMYAQVQYLLLGLVHGASADGEWFLCTNSTAQTLTLNPKP